MTHFSEFLLIRPYQPFQHIPSVAPMQNIHFNDLDTRIRDYLQNLQILLRSNKETDIHPHPKV